LTETDAPDFTKGAEEVLLDENKQKAEGGHDFYMVGLGLIVDGFGATS
jgi:hypothetical protein